MRAFTALVQAESFTAASVQMHLTQPALTRTIQQLERALGVPLVIRSSTRFELTEAGVRFYERSQRVLAEVDASITEARGYRKLTIGFSWILPHPWILSVTDTYEKKSGVGIHLKRYDDLASALIHRDIDVAIARHELCSGEIISICLHSEPRVVAVGKRLELSQRTSMEWNELSNYPVVINTTNGSTNLDQWDTNSRPQVVLTCENYDEWAALVATGKGIGTLAKSAADIAQFPGITFLPLENGPLAQLFLAIRRGEKSSLVNTFIEVASSIPMDESGRSN